MAHHRFDVLELLLKDLDDDRNDIFLHVDKKNKKVPFNLLRKCVQKSNLIFIKRIPVYWGGYSQIKCVLNLLETAFNTAKYDYYHLLVGVEFPLKSQDYIHKFFENFRGKEFIGFDNNGNYAKRLKYYRFWAKYERSSGRFKKILYEIDRKFLRFQERIGVNRLTQKEEYYHKGYANWSITSNLVKYILPFKKSIKKMYKYTACADEVFLHTIVYHSKFINNVYDINNEYHSCMRITTWDDPHNQYHFQ